MAVSPQFKEFVEELFAQTDPISIRAMFGGIGMFRHGLMFAIATSEERIALKADNKTIPEFQASNASRWNFRDEEAKQSAPGYWYVPEELLEQPEEFAHWADRAFDVAMRADAKKPLKQQKYKPL